MSGGRAVFDEVCFTIPLGGLELPGPNSRLHPFARHRKVAEARRLVACLARAERLRAKVKPVAVEVGVRLTLVRGKGQRMLDPDNAYGVCKVILDALRDAEWVPDDSSQWLTSYEVGQERGPVPAVRVEIWG